MAHASGSGLPRATRSRSRSEGWGGGAGTRPRLADAGWRGTGARRGPASGTAYALHRRRDARSRARSRVNPWDSRGERLGVRERSNGSTMWQAFLVACGVPTSRGTSRGQGTSAAAVARLDHLAACHTAVELMPLPTPPASALVMTAWAGRARRSYGPPGTQRSGRGAAREMVLLARLKTSGPRAIPLAYAPVLQRGQTPWAGAPFDGRRLRTVRSLVHTALLDREFTWTPEARCGMRSGRSPSTSRDIGGASALARAKPHVPWCSRTTQRARLIAPARGEARATSQWNDDWHQAALSRPGSDGTTRAYRRAPHELARAREGFPPGRASAPREAPTRPASRALPSRVVTSSNHDQAEPRVGDGSRLSPTCGRSRSHGALRSRPPCRSLHVDEFAPSPPSSISSLPGELARACVTAGARSSPRSR